MRHIFKEYNRLDENEIKRLWDNAIFVFDTNVLLNLYRYSEETSKLFLETIKSLKEKIWIPYQVGLEFNRNRIEVINTQKSIYSEFNKKLRDLINEVENKSRNPFLSNDIVSRLIDIKNTINNEVETKIDKYESQIREDFILEEINNIFESKIGEIFNEDELKKLYIEGESRYKNSIPPGYKDKAKPESQKYGDLIIWKQIIKQCKEQAKGLIFILDDNKEDWWFDYQGKTISPRPELIKEFRELTNQEMHFYKPFQFLEYVNQKIEERVLEEVKNYKINTDITTNEMLITAHFDGLEDMLNNFANNLRNNGYRASTEKNILTIILPNIPDLERRLKERYLSHIEEYSLTLIKYQINFI